MKARIIKRTHVNGSISYVIQQRHSLFFWWWVDAWLNSMNIGVTDSFTTLEEAQRNLCYFDGSKCVDKVVVNGGSNTLKN